MTTEDKIYRVLFHQNKDIYEVYVHNIYQGNMHGFVEIEDFIYGERTHLIDPQDEKLRNEFKEVKRSYIPHFNIIRIDEVNKQGMNRIHKSTADGRPQVSFPPYHKSEKE